MQLSLPLFLTVAASLLSTTSALAVAPRAASSANKCMLILNVDPTKDGVADAKGQTLKFRDPNDPHYQSKWYSEDNPNLWAVLTGYVQGGPDNVKAQTLEIPQIMKNGKLVISDGGMVKTGPNDQTAGNRVLKIEYTQPGQAKFSTTTDKTPCTFASTPGEATLLAFTCQIPCAK